MAQHKTRLAWPDSMLQLQDEWYSGQVHANALAFQQFGNTCFLQNMIVQHPTVVHQEQHLMGCLLHTTVHTLWCGLAYTAGSMLHILPVLSALL